MSVDVSKIEEGDRVKVSLYDLPESDWLEVKRTSESRYEGREVLIEMPEGGELWVSPRDIIAHEPTGPALPDWLAAMVIKDGNGYLGLPDMRSVVFASGAVLGWQEVAEPVTVIVDRDGNLPAAEQRDPWLAIAGQWEAKYHEARADLEAFRAEVEDLRNDVRYLFDSQIEQRLTAILDGADQ